MSATTHPAEVANRTRKAMRLANVIGHVMANTDVAPADRTELVDAFTDADWTMVATLAGTNPPSPSTRAAVLAILTERASLGGLS